MKARTFLSPYLLLLLTLLILAALEWLNVTSFGQPSQLPVQPDQVPFAGYLLFAARLSPWSG